MRKATFSVIFLLLTLVSYTQESFSLEESIQYALNNSCIIKLANLDIEDAEAQITEFKAIGLPKVDAGVNYQHYFEIPVNPVEDFITPSIYGVLSQEFDEIEPLQGEPEVFEFTFLTKNNLIANLEAQWLLFDGSYLSGLKAVKIFRELTRKSVDVKEEEIRGNVTKAYMNILIAEESKSIIQNDLEVIGKALDETKAFYENGFMESLDVERLELSVSNLQTELEKVDQLIDISYNLLKFQMTYPVNQQIIVSENLQSLVDLMSIESVDLSEDVDYNNRAQYAEINTNKELNDMNLERLKRLYLPTLKASAGYSQSLQRNDLFDSEELPWIPTGYVSLGINMPIFDGLQKKGQIQQAKIVLDKIDIQKYEFERAVNLEVSNARLNYINSKKTLDNVRKNLTIITSIYDKTMIKFKEGVGSSVEVTQAETQLLEIQRLYINALYDLLISKTDLDIALGKI